MEPAHQLFVCGLHRSGTTMIERFIQSRFDVAVLRANAPENEGQHMQDVYPTAKLYGGPGRFAFAPEMHPAPPPAEEAAALRKRLLACWSKHVQGDTDHLLEKSPPNLTKIAWLRALFPSARFLVVTRDPRAVAMATRKWSKSTLEELIFHWHVAHSIAVSEMGDDCMLIRYEDFCEDPERLASMLKEETALRRSEDVRSVDERFSDIKAQNSKYLDVFPERYFGPGIWEHFGYRL